jgi:glycerophosphoryl diester phosphodiesterase
VQQDLESFADELESTPVGDLFDEFDLDLDSYRADLDGYLADNLEASMDVHELSEMAQQLIQSEILLGVELLDEVRSRPLLAHRVRGFAEDEASAEALEAALEEDVFELEFDIRMSADGVPMIHHNSTLGESAGRPESIADLTAAELAEVTLRGGGHIASLREFFDLVESTENRGTKINIDIKDFDPEMLDSILDLIDEYDVSHRVVLVSWFPQALQYMYEKNPSLPYSLSYFPTTTSLTGAVFGFLNGGSGPYEQATGRASEMYAEKVEESRVAAAAAGQAPVLDVVGENVTGAYVVDPGTHWTDLEVYAAKAGESLVGKHTMSLAGAPFDIPLMAQVLASGGSINVLSLEAQVDKVVKKTHLSERARDFLGNMDEVVELASACAASGIEVNIFDLVDPELAVSHFERFEDQGVEAGVVYSSNKDMIPRLRLRRR